MTTIKIPFTKKSIRQISASELVPGTKGLELEIQTDFLVSQLCSLKNIAGGPVADGSFEKIALIFKDDGGQLICDSLNENQNFELSFDKEKVWLNVFGFADVIDKTKPEVQVSPGKKSLVIFFETKFAGIITVESKDGEEKKPEEKKPEEKKDNTPDISVVRKYSKDNDIRKLEYDEETGKLVIFYKSNKPNKEISDLDNADSELQELKRYLQSKGKKWNNKLILEENDWKQQQVQTKNNYTPWLIGGGILLFVIVILALVGMTKSNKD